MNPIPEKDSDNSWNEISERPKMNLHSPLSALFSRLCFDLFEMFFEMKRTSFSFRFFSQIAPHAWIKHEEGSALSIGQPLSLYLPEKG